MTVVVFLTKSNTIILREIASILGMILEGIYSVLGWIGVNNVGVSIILFTFIVNALMIPLTIKQQKYTRLSAKMNPELMKIQEKYKGKKDSDSLQKMNAEREAIYQKYGASPTGGCLPLLITLPIMFALYRVIYNIPAYVPAIRDIYMKVVDALQTQPDFPQTLEKFVRGTKDALDNAVTVSSIGNKDVIESITKDANAKNYIIDILSQFKTVHWDELKNSFQGVSGVINSAYDELVKVNTFLGMNIAENPSFRNFTVTIPILAVVTQFIQNKVTMSANTAGKKDSNDTMTSSMNAMNNVMPIMSGGFCFILPIGIGLYWVAGSVFRIIQTLFINQYLGKIDVETLVEKNNEKKKKKIVKQESRIGKKVEDYARKKTSSIETNVNSNQEKNGKGSISDYAKMLSKKRDNK